MCIALGLRMRENLLKVTNNRFFIVFSSSLIIYNKTAEKNKQIIRIICTLKMASLEKLRKFIRVNKQMPHSQFL